MTRFKFLEEFCLAQNLPWTDEAAQRFSVFVELLLKFNKSMNLIGPMDAREVEEKLLIDSLTAAATYAPTGSILDIGTGAGFPGIPLKILYPDLPITLIEPRKKRVQFMKIATNRLKFSELEITEERIENIDLPPHDYVISKAFREPTEWLRIAAPLRSETGVIVAMHAPEPELLIVAENLGLSRLEHTASVKQAYGAHEGVVVRSISVFG